MVDANNPNYSQMMKKIENIHQAIAEFQSDIWMYIPSGVADNYMEAKDRFDEQLNEIESLVQEWANKK